MNRESVERPIAILSRLIETEGDSARFQSALARAYLNKYVFTSETQYAEKALQACTRAITLAPDQPETYQVIQGSINIQFSRYAEAVDDFKAALNKNPPEPARSSTARWIG